MMKKQKLIASVLTLAAVAFVPLAQATTLGSQSDSSAGSAQTKVLYSTFEGRLITRGVNLTTRSGRSGTGFVTLNDSAHPKKIAVKFAFICSDGTENSHGSGVGSDSLSTGEQSAFCDTNRSVSFIRGEYKINCPTNIGDWKDC